VINNHPIIARFAIIITLFTAGSVQAGQITGFTWFSGVASVAATTIAPPVNPNNDNVGLVNPNDAWITQKNYVAIGPVDLVFTVANSGGTTEYSFREGVFNNTTLPWTGYHLELGFGNGLTYTKSTLGDGLDFDAPTYDSTIDFTPYFPSSSATTEDDIVAGGGVHPYLGFAPNYRFSVDVPDGITSFTIRQSPIGGGIVPEPCTWVLGSLGLFSFSMYRRRRKK
jgi:hypothetical protein